MHSVVGRIVIVLWLDIQHAQLGYLRLYVISINYSHPALMGAHRPTCFLSMPGTYESSTVEDLICTQTLRIIKFFPRPWKSSLLGAEVSTIT